MVKPHHDRVQSAWELLEGPPSDEETAAEVEHLAKLEPDALDRELEEGGFDLRQVEADAERLRQRWLQAAPDTPLVDRAPVRRAEPPQHAASAVDAVVPRVRSRRRGSEYLSAFVLGALVLALAIGFVLHPHRVREAPIARPDVPSLPSPPSPSASPSSTPPEAVTLRIRAAAACNEEAWQDCIDWLDRAARLDPAGDAAPEIRALRQRAENVELHPIGRKPTSHP